MIGQAYHGRLVEDERSCADDVETVDDDQRRDGVVDEQVASGSSAEAKMNERAAVVITSLCSHNRARYGVFRRPRSVPASVG